ncbi:MAG: glycoside hydrolase family 97 protein [Muribaculaceae bacterium]
MTKKIILLSIFASSFIMAAATSEVVTGPDGRLVVTVSDNNGRPEYKVDYDGIPFILPSALGLDTDMGDFRSGMTILKASPVENIDETYSIPNIKKSTVHHRANSRKITFARDGKKIFDVIFEVSDNDVAYRYNLRPHGESLSAIVLDEASSFVMPEATTTFLCPQSLPGGGWKHTYPSYETEYTLDDKMGKNGEGAGFTFPCLFRNGDNGWMLINETGVDQSYCGSRLVSTGADSYKIAFPQEKEMKGLGWTTPGLNLPGLTPWRTITVGRDLAPVVESTVAFDVVDQLYEPSIDYAANYGKGTWNWIMNGDGAVNFDQEKRYIDLAADLGYQTVLVDGLWDKQIGRDGIEKLAAYAKEKGVALYLWYNSNGYWNDAPQGPRGIMNNSIARKKEMKWMRELGVKGIKVDFFGGDNQPMMQLYQDILSDANDYGIIVIFHGCTLPRGWERMYPNYGASEAVLASENLNFQQHFCDLEAVNAATHPFIRNTMASMDFGGSALNKYWNTGNKKGGSERRTSDVFALATAVLFQSPVPHFALAPNNLSDAPEWAIDFMKEVPVTWDDVRFVDGYPGRYVVMARRHGDKWYLVGVNASDKPVEIDINSVGIYEAGKTVTVYSDDKTLAGSVKQVKLSPKKKIRFSIPKNGGIVVMD